MFEGTFITTCRDKHGNLKWRDIHKNLVTLQGKRHLLDTTFGTSSPITTWYIGFHTNNAYTPSSSLTYQNWSGFFTEFTNYNESTRPAWVPVAAASGEIAYTSASPITINTTATLRGMFMCGGPNAQTKNNSQSGNVLYSHSGVTRAVVSGDIIDVQYSL